MTTGEVILKMEPLRHEMEQIAERIVGATNPDALAQYQLAISEKRAVYNELKKQLKECRNADLIELEDAKAKVEAELEVTFDMHDIQEKEEILRGISDKIVKLLKVIVDENNN